MTKLSHMITLRTQPFSGSAAKDRLMYTCEQFQDRSDNVYEHLLDECRL